MSAAGLVLIATVMLAGLVGAVVPGVPGLVVIWLAGLAWALFEDGSGPWVVLGVLTALLTVGTVAGYAVPAKTLGGQVPRSTLVLGVLGAVVGMFVIPVVGLPIGGVAAVYAAERRRTRSHGPAWASTKLALRGFGLGILVEVLAGLLMVGAWVVGVWVA